MTERRVKPVALADFIAGAGPAVALGEADARSVARQPAQQRRVRQ